MRRAPLASDSLSIYLLASASYLESGIVCSCNKLYLSNFEVGQRALTHALTPIELRFELRTDGFGGRRLRSGEELRQLWAETELQLH